MKKIKVGLVGLGWVCNAVHIDGYKQVPDCEITAICDIKPDRLNKVGDELGIPENRRFSDYRDLIACDDVEVVDIATWNSVHCEIAMTAVNAGKDFSVEKPVGMNYAEALELANAAKEKGVKSFVTLSWRYRPYTRYVKHLISSGLVGELYHIYVRCIKDSGLWEGRPREWRFDASRGGTGVLGDLGSHMVDIVRFWGYEFVDVFAKRGTFITERPSEETGEIVPVDTDDWCNMIATLDKNTSCTIDVTRCATTVANLMQFEVYGENGKLIYTFLDDEQTIEFVDAKTKEKKMLTPPEEFNAIQSGSFINLVNGVEDEFTAKIEQGLECQAVLDAMLISCEEKRLVTIAEIKGE